MHAKTDSEVTSLADSSPPRSPRGGGGGGRQIYYVMSPSHPDVEKVSIGGSSPGGGSPIHHFHHHHQRQQNQHNYYYASSPIHYSRESTATRLSASLKPQPSSSAWQKLQRQQHTPSHHSGSGDAASDLSDSDSDAGGAVPFRCYVAWFILGFFVLFTVFSLIIWAASRPYKPEIAIKSVIFESYDIHAGMDLTGVPTKMLSINSTVKIAFRNPATFFGVHVSATPLELFYSDLQIATGHMEEFYQIRKSGRMVSTIVSGQEVPLYGGGSSLSSRTESGTPAAVVPLDLRFVVRARAYVLGHLVRTKFYRHIHCSLLLREARLGKPLLRLNKACSYHD